MRSANPALKPDTFSRFGIRSETGAMTLQGTAMKTVFLLLVAALSASWVWGQYFAGNKAIVGPAILIGALGGFVVALITIFKPNIAHITGLLYSGLQGLALGGISAMFEAKYNGLPLQAVGLTFATLLALLLAYQTGLIKATENFKLGVIAATGGIALFYFLGIVLSLFGIQMPLIHSNGIMGIAFSGFVVVVAALNLVLDFDFIESGVEAGAPKHLEWYAAFALVLTLFWLYLSCLELLRKLQSR